MFQRLLDSFLVERESQRARLHGAPSFSGVLDQLVEVPADRQGRPGYVLTTGGPSLHVRARGAQGSRSDLCVSAGSGTLVLSTCVGRTTQVGDPARSAQRAAEHLPEQHACTLLEPPVATTFAGVEAVTLLVSTPLAGSADLRIESRDWHLSHAGWSFVAGYLHPPRGTTESRATAEQILRSWRWVTG